MKMLEFYIDLFIEIFDRFFRLFSFFLSLSHFFQNIFLHDEKIDEIFSKPHLRIFNFLTARSELATPKFARKMQKRVQNTLVL